MTSRSSHPFCSTHSTSTYPPTAADFAYRKVLRSTPLLERTCIVVIMTSRSSHPFCSTHSTSTYPPTAADFAYRKVLRQAVAAICKQAGFEIIESSILELLTHMISQAVAAICKQAGFEIIESSILELLTHMISSYILEMGVVTRQFTELAGRTISTPSDVVMALIDLGIAVTELPDFLAKCRSQGSLVIAQPKVQAPPATPIPLRVGNARPHHPHIPDSLPPFPDPHTYIRTEISGDPELTYEKVRESSAQLKRNSEASLRDFMLRSHPSSSVFSSFEQRIRHEARLIISGDPELTYEKVRESSAQLKRNSEASLRDFMLRSHPSSSVEKSAMQQNARLMARQTERLNDELRKDRDEGMPDLFESNAEKSVPLVSEHIYDFVEKSAMQQNARLMARQTERLNDELRKDRDEGMPDLFESNAEKSVPLEEESVTNEHVADILAENLFVLNETENSLLRKRLPSLCQIIEPSLDNSPYLGALLCEELNDEGTEVPTSPPPTHAHSHTNNEGGPGGEEAPSEENPYLRRPRMPLHDDDHMEM
uniref:Transcription initiation factor TFIID subunit 8 n=1 Tax=Ascaris lumbricoides TaxID=6252 RepID=A0A9J2PYN7_ASCLU